jgi:hypothetical protein
VNSTDFFILPGIILVSVILIVILITRLNRKLWQRAQEMLKNDPGFEAGFRNGLETEAKVISKNETIVQSAGGYAKVDLLMEVQLPDKEACQISACWLVEIDSLDKVSPGKNVPVKVDLRIPIRMIPNIPWAKPWIFGK